MCKQKHFDNYAMHFHHHQPPTTFESLMNAMIQYSYDNQDGDGDECVDNDLDSNFLVSL